MARDQAIEFEVVEAAIAAGRPDLARSLMADFERGTLLAIRTKNGEAGVQLTDLGRFNLAKRRGELQ